MGWTDKLAEMLRLNDGEQAYVGYPQMQVGLNKPRQAGYATGFLEGATGMDSMQPKNPITDPNFSAYEQGKNTGEAVGIGAMALPAYAMALRAGAPKAYNALENYMVKSGGMIPLEAYHGTPHEIKGGFDISKVGTGEGAQAYGHGMYFAEAKPVAEQYIKAGDEGFKINAAEYAIKEYGNVDNAIQQLSKKLLDKNEPAWKKDNINVVLQGLNKVKSGEPTGNLYKVDIPDEYIPNMLDWDKPLSEQSDFIKKAFNYKPAKMPTDLKAELTGQSNPDWKYQVGGFPAAPTAEKAIQNALNSMGMSKSNIGKTGEELYKEIARKYATEKNPLAFKEASEELSKLGIKGVRYLDEGSRKSGKGTSNFVVFDPSEVKILEKNSKPISRKDLIEEQVNKLKD